MSKGGSNSSTGTPKSPLSRSRQLSNSRFAGIDYEESPFPPPAKLRARNLAELFFEQAIESDLSAFAQFRDYEDHGWITISYREAALLALGLAKFLSSRGVKHGDRVAIISSTRYEWIVADLAILSLGAISVSVYQTLTASETGYVLWDSGALHVIVENEEQLEKLRKLEAQPVHIPERENFGGGVVQLHFHTVVSIEECSDSSSADRFFSFGDIIYGSTDSPLQPELANISTRLAEINREQIATIVYTSGTTGPPKGVIQTHGNHLAMIEMVLLSGLMGSGKGVFLYLPLAHSFARLIPFVVLAVGGDLFLPTVLDKKTSRFEAKHLLADIAAASPLIVPSVPRIFEKIMSVLDVREPKTIREKLVKWSITTRRKHFASAAEERSTTPALTQLKLALAELVTAKVRHRIFGKRLQYAISGGAPISVEVLEFFRAIGVLILEGYGLTETTPALTVNTVKLCKFGTVGRPFDGIELRIAPADGEILARGANMAKGYWRCPQATDQAWSKDGWFATGDIGEIDNEGFLRITDRKKDLIVTAGGKKIPPAMLEGQLKNSSYISQALVFGERKPYLVALITLDEANIRQWAHAQSGITNDSLESLADSHLVQKLIASEVEKLNISLAGFEQIKRFKVLAHDFTIENGLLSPSLKVKRKLATERYRAELEELYGTSAHDISTTLSPD